MRPNLQIGRAWGLPGLFAHSGGNRCLDPPDGFAKATGNREPAQRSQTGQVRCKLAFNG